MKDEDKTKDQLINELIGLRQRIAELEKVETELKGAQEEAGRRLERLKALREIDRAISSSLELKDRLDVLLDKLTELPHIHGVAVMVLKPHTTELETVAVRDLSEEFAKMAEVRLKDGLPHLVAEQEKPLVIADLMTNERVVHRELFKREELASYIGLPFLAKGELIGVLGIYSRERHLWSQEQTDFLHTLAGQAAIAIENARAYQRVEEQNLQIITALATAVEARDPYTSGHSQKVTEHAVAIAQELGLPENEIENLRWASLLHDIGTIGISDVVLSKPTTLTAAEDVMIKAHPAISADIVGKIEGLVCLVPVIRHHHERWDGTGYPDGLKGEEIPLLARILAVADSFDAMTSERPYRWALTKDEVLAELKKGAGTHWDPEVVKVFLELRKSPTKPK